MGKGGWERGDQPVITHAHRPSPLASALQSLWYHDDASGRREFHGGGWTGAERSTRTLRINVLTTGWHWLSTVLTVHVHQLLQDDAEIHGQEAFRHLCAVYAP